MSALATFDGSVLVALRTIDVLTQLVSAEGRKMYASLTEHLLSLLFHLTEPFFVQPFS